jgi:transcriptional regulator with XRE-family HTH domain
MEKSIFTPEYEALSRVLVRCRQDAGLTQIELAEELETTQSSVSKLERGALRLDVIQLRTVCKALGISLSEFVQKLEKELSGPKARPGRCSTKGRPPRR